METYLRGGNIMNFKLYKDADRYYQQIEAMYRKERSNKEIIDSIPLPADQTRRIIQKLFGQEQVRKESKRAY